VLNIVVGVIVETTLQASRENEEKLQKEKDTRHRKDEDVFSQILLRANIDRDGTVTRKQFVKCFKEADLKMLGLPSREAGELFHILDISSKGELRVQELIAGCLQMKDEVQGKDIMMMVMDLKTVRKRVEKIEGLLGAPEGEELKDEQTNLNKLRTAFEKIDKDGDGMLSRAEFESVCKKDEAKEAFQALNIWSPENELGVLFDVLDANKDGCIGLEEFLEGSRRLRGAAKAQEQIFIIREMQLMSQRQDAADQRLVRMSGQLDYVQDWQVALGSALTSLLVHQGLPAPVWPKAQPTVKLQPIDFRVDFPLAHSAAAAVVGDIDTVVLQRDMTSHGLNGQTLPLYENVAL